MAEQQTVDAGPGLALAATVAVLKQQFGKLREGARDSVSRLEAGSCLLGSPDGSVRALREAEELLAVLSVDARLLAAAADQARFRASQIRTEEERDANDG